MLNGPYRDLISTPPQLMVMVMVEMGAKSTESLRPRIKPWKFKKHLPFELIQTQ